MVTPCLRRCVAIALLAAAGVAGQTPTASPAYVQRVGDFVRVRLGGFLPPALLRVASVEGVEVTTVRDVSVASAHLRGGTDVELGRGTAATVTKLIDAVLAAMFGAAAETPSPTAAATASCSTSGSHSASASHTQSASVSTSSSRTMSPSHSASTTAAPSRSLSPTPSPSWSSSPTPSWSPSPTPSWSPTAMPSPAALDALDLVVVRLGDDAAADVGVGSAYDVWLDVYTPEGTLRRSVPLTGGRARCRLSRGVTAETQVYDNDGLISVSADGRLVSLPCFDIGAGQAISLYANKTVATLSYTGAVAFSAPIVGTFEGSYVEVGYDVTGVRQAATVNGSGFWLTGASQAGWGFRYLPSLDAGYTNYVNGAFLYDAGFYDARGVAAYGGQLYGSDSTFAMGAYNTFGGVFTIGTGLPTFEPIPPFGADPFITADPNATVTTLLPGFDGNEAYLWAFCFQGDADLWIAYSYTPQWMGGAFSDDDAAVLAALANTTNANVTVCAGAVLHYALADGAWSLAAAVCVDPFNPVFSVTGRYEGGDWIAYATSVDALWRLNATSGVVTGIAAPAPHRYFRSVAVAPRAA
jgi:hypothetical protein